MQKVKKVFLASITVFSMFFGAGNLLYPLIVGSISNSSYPMGIAGLFITGILIPLIGLISIVLYYGDIDEFFGKLGKNFSLVLIILILAIIGPFGAIPRCTIVAFSGFKLFFPYVNTVLFNFAIYVVMFVCVYHKNKVVEIVGKWLTPIFLFGIAVIIFFAIKVHYESYSVGEVNDNAFFVAFMEGYQTMDLCAAFFFGKIIFDYFKNSFQTQGVSLVQYSLISSVIGVLMLLLTYVAFIYIGAKYSDYLSQFPKSDVLVQISVKVLGRYASIFSGLTIFFACITTAIALESLVSEWISTRFNLQRIYAIMLVSVLSFIIASLGFVKITYLMGEILYYIYPALISLSVSNIVHYVYPKLNFVKPLFVVALLLSVSIKCFIIL